MDKRKLRTNKVPIEKEIERFLSRVDKKSESECWIWAGRTNPDGYGQFDCRNSTVPSHRYMWSMLNGEIPQGMVICHRCDNPKCVNPSHLFLGTVQDNVRDRDMKGRQADHAGTKNGRAVLDENGAIKVKELRKSGLTYKDISTEMGVSVGCVSHILNGRHWVGVSNG